MQDAVCQTSYALVPTPEDLAVALTLEAIAKAARAVIDAAEDLDAEYRRKLNRWPQHVAREAGRLRSGYPYPDLLDIADEPVRIARGPGAPRTSVPVRALGGFCLAVREGGRSRALPAPMLAAYVSCDRLPVAFGHDCQHGPPPHRIRVVIPRGHNDGMIYGRLRRLGEGRRHV